MDRIDADLCRLGTDLYKFGTAFGKFGVAMDRFEANLGNIVSNLVLTSVIANRTWVPENWKTIVSTMNFNVLGMGQVLESFDQIREPILFDLSLTCAYFAPT